MQYLSLQFALFVFLTFGLYYVLPRACRWFVLLCASLFFYLCYDVRYILFLLFVAISTFLCAKVERSKRKNKENLAIGILLCTGLWFLIKVLPWVVTVANTFLSRFIGDFQIPIPKFLVPLGISYYVLLSISYVVDVYKKKIKPEKNFLVYLLYLSYFPTIVQGPISKYEQLRNQFTAGRRIGYTDFKRNLLLISFGLIKKMVIADRVAILANHCFANYADMEGVILYIGAVCYSIQLYMDFSGCVDICRGVSAMFGINLIDNFSGPYFSKSIKEFWSKWHISLSTWLKDYIYIPLGGNRKGKARKYVNLLATFFVSGIWHGAGINFMVWGLLQGIYQIVGECTENGRTKVKKLLGIQPDSITDKIYRTIITFNLTTFAWIFFRSGRFLYALEYIGRMFSDLALWGILDGSIFIKGFSFAQVVFMMINLILITIVDYLKTKRNVHVEDSILKTHIVLRWSIYLVLIFNVILFGVYGKGYDLSGFLYGGF